MQVQKVLAGFNFIIEINGQGIQQPIHQNALGAITTTNFSFNTPISRLRSGVGVYVNQDKNSPITNLEAQGFVCLPLSDEERKIIDWCKGWDV